MYVTNLPQLRTDVPFPIPPPTSGRLKILLFQGNLKTNHTLGTEKIIRPDKIFKKKAAEIITSNI